ncbi:hypothetical protein SCACP_38440 [Sporomusa carbonis]|uniref:helix-turn-helix domain-containing protein n=1 Tax=Sporomusa carbonis TaxID=3076075 RepID=UPI003A6AD196
MNNLGSYIRAKRDEKGLSLRDFAKQCGLSHSYIDNIEKGYDSKTKKPMSPTLDTLEKLAIGLGVPLSDVMIQAGYNGFIQTTKKITFSNQDNMYNVVARSSALPKEIREQFVNISIDQIRELEKAFSKNIKKLRIKQRRTLQEIADLCGVSESTIEEWETGNNPPPSETIIQKLAQHYGVSVESLFEPQDNKTPSSLPPLTPKDEREIAKDLETILNALDNKSGTAAYNDPEDEEDRELLRASLLTSMKLAKQIAKKKFTPKKYRKE